MDGWKMSFLLGLPIFRGYVKLRGGSLQNIQFFVDDTPPKINSSNLKMMVWKMMNPFAGVCSQVPWIFRGVIYSWWMIIYTLW